VGPAEFRPGGKTRSEARPKAATEIFVPEAAALMRAAHTLRGDHSAVAVHRMWKNSCYAMTYRPASYPGGLWGCKMLRPRATGPGCARALLGRWACCRPSLGKGTAARLAHACGVRRGKTHRPGPYPRRGSQSLAPQPFHPSQSHSMLRP